MEDIASENALPVKVQKVIKDVADVADNAAPRHTLCDLQKDYKFFTTGVITAITNWERDPVKEFMVSHFKLIEKDTIGVFNAVAPFFNGLGVAVVDGKQINLDHRLHAVHNAVWEKCSGFIGSIVLTDPRKNLMYRVVSNTVLIVDEAKLKTQRIITDLPAVPVTVFGVMTDTQFSSLQSAVYPAIPYLQTIMASQVAVVQ
jgi:hypothetical protein